MRFFGIELQRARRPPTEAVQPQPPLLSGYLSYETDEDRLERIYGDALELLRRYHAGVNWSRRHMQHERMGGRRWASARAMLIRSGVINEDNDMIITNTVHARRSLSACRQHYLRLIKMGHCVLPF